MMVLLSVNVVNVLLLGIALFEVRHKSIGKDIIVDNVEGLSVVRVQFKEELYLVLV